MSTKEELQAQADAEIEAAKPLNKSVNGVVSKIFFGFIIPLGSKVDFTSLKWLTKSAPNILLSSDKDWWGVFRLFESPLSFDGKGLKPVFLIEWLIDDN